MKRILPGLAALLSAIAILGACEIVAMSPFPMAVALADRMVKIKSIMHGVESHELRMNILKNGQYLALAEGKDHLAVFDRDLNLKYTDSQTGQYGQNMSVVEVATSDFLIGNQRINSTFTTNAPHGFVADWFYYYESGGTYYGIRLNGGSVELSSSNVFAPIAGPQYVAPVGWQLDRVQTDLANGKVGLMFRESGDKNNTPHMVMMNLADAMAGSNPFVGAQRSLPSTETDKTFMVRGGFVSHGYSEARAYNLDLSDRKTIYDSALSRMAVVYSPDSDRFYVYDDNSGYLYRCKPWW